MKIGNRQDATVNGKKAELFGFALCALLFALSFPAAAQQAKKIPRIGFLSGSGDPNTPGLQLEAFRRGLQELGYIEGKNILVEYRYVEGRVDRIPSLVAELVQLKVDVVVAAPLSAIRAAKRATRTIPIVMLINGNPVELGIIESLARPGGNITGLTRFNRELSGKRLELFKEVVPGIVRVGVLNDAEQTGSGAALEVYEPAARVLKIPLSSLKIHGPNPDLEGSFRAAAKIRVGGIIVTRSGLLFRYRKKIADLSIRNRLPSMSEGSDFVEAGGLVSYASNDAESYRRAATYVDKILKGAKPADLPVEQPTKFEFVINLKTAKALNLTIPQSVLFRADRVIR